MPVKVDDYELERGIEFDLAAAHATPDGYGRLTIRKNKNDDKDLYEIYDLDNETIVEQDTDLEQIVRVANEYTPLTFEYEENTGPSSA